MTNLQSMVFPAGEIERLFSLVPMLRVEVQAQQLHWFSILRQMKARTYLVYVISVHPHAIIRLYSLASEINRSCCPMRIAVIYRNKDDIFGK